MRLALALLVGSLIATCAQAAAPAAVEVKDAVARVTVIPEDRADIRVEVLTANPRLPWGCARRATAPSSMASWIRTESAPAV